MRALIACCILLIASTLSAADPPWSACYNYGQSPEQNGFTRSYYGNPDGATVTENKGGNPANRNVQIQTQTFDDGAVFITSQVPSLNENAGATAEASVRVTGNGNAGVELTFLGIAYGISVYASSVYIDVCYGAKVSVPTPPNTSYTLFRTTYKAGEGIKVYRAGALIWSGAAAPCPKPYQRVLWWSESGGTSWWNKLCHWSGGAMAP